MSAAEKAEVLTKVASAPRPKGKVLRELAIPKSTYYRWLRRQDHQGLEDLQEEVGDHGTVLLFGKNAQSWLLPGRCQS